MTRVSIVITAYNHERFIGQAIESVLAQRGPFSLEVIVGDDASTDGTLAIARSYEERFPDVVRVLPPPVENLRFPRNFERCVRAATGDFVSVCDGDDYFCAGEKLALEVGFLRRRQDCALCFSAMVLKNDATGVETLHPGQVPYMGGEHTFSTRDLVTDYLMGTFGTYRSEVIRALPSALYALEMADWIFNIACSRLGNVGFVNTRAYVTRLHADNTVSGRTPAFQIRSVLAHIGAYDRFLNFEFHAEFAALEAALAAQLATVSTPS
jgi:glycosyltransferase involved in cell wall biosynthesis